MVRRWQIRNVLLTAMIGGSTLALLVNARAAAAAPDQLSSPAPVEVVAPAFPQPPESALDFSGARFKRPPIGFGYGVFIPSSGKTRNRFGGSWGGFGIGIGAIQQAVIPGRFSFDVGFDHQTAPGAYIWITRFGIKYERALTRGAPLRPFVGATADLEPVSLRSDPDNIRAGYHLAFGGSLFVGSNITRHAYLRAGYSAVSMVEGFDFSGFNAGAGVRF